MATTLERDTTTPGPRRVLAAVCGAVVAIAAVWARTTFPDDYLGIQAATGDRLAKLLDGRSLGPTLTRDDIYAAIYGLLGTAGLVAAFARGKPWRRLQVAAVVLLPVGAFADFTENELLRQLDGRKPGASFGRLDEAMHMAGVVKWTAIAIVVVGALWSALTPRRPKRPVVKGQPGTRPPWHPAKGKGNEPGPWDPPAGEKERLGICCSGGGIRSAAFSLGALQVLEQRGLLRKAEYLAAVSGGGYMAAGFHLANHTLPGRPPATGPPRPYAPGSPEERWFRDHSSYLVPNFGGALSGIGTLLAGLAFNLLIVGLVLFAAARPVGWAMGWAHPELRLKDPIALVESAKVVPRVAAVTPVAGGDDDAQLFEVTLTTEKSKGACVDLRPFDAGQGDFALGVTTARPGLVEVRGNKAAIVRQPTVKHAWVDDARARVTAPKCRMDEPLRELFRDTKVERQPTVKLQATGVADAGTLADLLAVEKEAVLVPQVGLRGRDDVTIEAIVWWLCLPLLLFAVLVAFFKTVLGVHGRLRRIADWAQRVAAPPGAIVFAVFVALPWLTQELTKLLIELESTADGTLIGSMRNYFVPGGGIVVLVTSAVRRFLATNQSRPGDAPKPPGGSLPQRLWRRVTGSSETLGWYELSPAKIAAGLVVAVVPVLIFLYMLVYAAANGPGGDLAGSAFLRDRLDARFWLDEWAKLAVALFVLVVLQRFVAAHNWSLHAFYKRKLSEAYLVRRGADGTASPVPFDAYPLPFHHGKRVDGFPKLILGCAVNLSEPGVVPPARRAASFTFSADEIGGPLVGYLSPRTYWRRLGKDRQKDVTLPAAMAISGAAFSPAMGKFNLGPVGSLYAFANLRLGVWLPHPAWVQANKAQWRDRPGWSWYLREIANRYALDSPYLYVSDGGHWENLGLVELLRRGCTQIVCINGGGDHQDSFGTIGQAVALAREELGVEIHIDPSPLRPAIAAQAAAAAVTRELRRRGAKNKAEPMASASIAEGTFTYPCGRQGVLWLIEPALTADMPIDVHVYAEGVSIFPDDSTGDQVFNHEQFEAFRALGAHQASRLP